MMVNKKAAKMAQEGRIIALTGFSGSGKDTCTAAAVSSYLDVKRLSFSDQLKRSACKIFPLLDLDYPPDIKNDPCLHWTDKSPREIWNYMDFMNDVDKYCFVRLLIEELEESDNDYMIITDVRKPAEFEFIKVNQIPLIHIDSANAIPNDKDSYVEGFSNYAEWKYTNVKDDYGRDFVDFLINILHWR